MATESLVDDEASAIERHLQATLEEWLAVADAPGTTMWPAVDELTFSGDLANSYQLVTTDDDVVSGAESPEAASAEVRQRTVAADARSRITATVSADDAVRTDDGEPQSDDAPEADADPDSSPTAVVGIADDPSVPPVPGDLLGGLTEIVDGLSAMAGADWHELDGGSAHQALDKVEQIARKLAAVRSTLLTTVEANCLWALDGTRSFAAWLRQRTETNVGVATKQVRESRALRDHLPLTRAALEAGEISQEHVSVLVREAVVTERLREVLKDSVIGEAFLVAKARELDAGTFYKLVKAWAMQADPEAADRNWRESDAKEEFSVAPTTGGYHLSGWLNDVSGQVVAAALSAHMGRKAADDERTASQRQAAALVSLSHQSLDAGLQGASARVRPHVTVTTPLATLRALAGAMGSAIPPIGHPSCPRTYDPGAAFGVAAEDTLDAVGGPRDPGAPADAPLFELSPEARTWADRWRPDDDHVISAAIDHDAMRGVEPATLEDGTPIPPALLARLACESELSRVVFGPDSTILDVGREKRIFTASQARAIIARDRHCQYPGVRREALVDRVEVRDLRRRACRSRTVKLRAA